MIISCPPFRLPFISILPLEAPGPILIIKFTFNLSPLSPFFVETQCALTTKPMAPEAFNGRYVLGVRKQKPEAKYRLS